MSAVMKAGEAESGSLMAVIARASTDPNCDIEKMERLLAMQERILDRNAKAAYADALARLQPLLPMITEKGAIKDRAGNVQSRYSRWEDIVAVITPILSSEGFSLSFRTRSDDKSVTVVGVLLHREGHSEQTELTLPMDTSGSKNGVQGVGSSTSYGKRYTSGALLNLRTGDLDDDGQSGGKKAATLDENQIANVTALLSEVGANKAAFLKWAKVDAVGDILAANYATVIREIEARRK